MKPKKFFIGRAVVLSILMILGLCIFAYQSYIRTKRDVAPLQHQENVLPAEAPFFTWRYERDTSLTPDGLPRTNVYLDATYSGRKMSTLIATTPGSCNDLPDKEKDSVPNSTVAQCYAAGYGDLFKVTKGESQYLIMHKVFEEASPDYNPPVQPYTVVAEFPLSI